MSADATTRPATARATWLLVLAAVVTAVLLALVPGLRSPGAAVTAWAGATAAAAGVARHRPVPPLPWVLLAVMLVLWSAATTAVQLEGRVSTPTAVLVGAGQVLAVVVTGWVLTGTGNRTGRGTGAGTPRRTGHRSPDEALVDGVIIATVLGLVTAQVVAVAVSSARSATTVLVPVVDVAVLGMLLRFLVTHRFVPVAGRLVLAAAVVTVAHDLSAAVHGDRLPLPGEPAQVLGAVCALLFGAAALHPSMVDVFAADGASRRAPSAALLGLLPLVAVPLGLWWVGRASDVRGLPTPVLLAGASAVAALCLVRASGALRSSEHLAEHDPLTDLVNRRGLARAFADAPSGGWALLLVDVDDFKQVNDAHGHAVGDELLLRVRDRLVAAAGRGAVVARLGGDEFVVLTGPERAQPVADEVLRSLREPVLLDVLEVRASASIGLAAADASAGLDDLVTRADVAMYTVKAAGRDGVALFEPRMRDEVSHRYGLTAELRRLLGRGAVGREGSLEVHYQPLVDLRSGCAVGAEALVRWEHPRHGLLGPAAFLDLVTTSGMDADLDAVVLRQVVHQLAAWRDGGIRPLPVSVNLTGASLGDAHLDDRLLALLAASAVPPSLLHLEITEHEELPPDGPAGETLRRLRDAGVAVHLDDYGTGYTSLSYLTRFPVEVLKLDRSVVETITAGEQAQLVGGIAAMAATLGLEVLAEGVETAAQRDLLLGLGVRYGQGYLFSRPLAADAYAELVLASPAPLPAVPVRPGSPALLPTAPGATSTAPGPTARPGRAPRPRTPADRGLSPAAAADRRPPRDPA